MSYDGIIMQRAIARFDQARQRREAELDQRRRERAGRAALRGTEHHLINLSGR